MEVKLLLADILDLQGYEAVVNSTNKYFLALGGLDRKIHNRAGKKLNSECSKMGNIDIGQAILTSSYDMSNYKYIIHTVCPNWRDNQEDILKECYIKSLECAAKHGIRTLVFPAIGIGNKGFPEAIATKNAVTALKEYSSIHINDIDCVAIAIIEPTLIEIYGTEMDKQEVFYEFENIELETLYEKNQKKFNDILSQYGNSENYTKDDVLKILSEAVNIDSTINEEPIRRSGINVDGFLAAVRHLVTPQNIAWAISMAKFISSTMRDSKK